MTDGKYVVGVFVLAVVVIGFVAYSMFNKAGSLEEPVLQFVSGTEYVSGELGQVIVEARFLNGSSALGSCTLLSWYPDKSLFFSVGGNLSVSGNVYTEFVVANVTGVYEYQAQCTYTNGKNGTISKSFHVSAFQNNVTARNEDEDARIYAVMTK